MKVGSTWLQAHRVQTESTVGCIRGQECPLLSPRGTGTAGNDRFQWRWPTV